MDVAALSLNIDSSSVLKAAADLDKFSAAAAKAGASSGSNSGSIAKLVATVQSMDSKLGSIVSALNRLSAANDNVAASSRASATAINTVSGSLRATMGPMSSVASSAATVSVNFAGMGAAAKQADAHVQAFRTNMAGVGTAIQQADAHIVAYRNHLASLPGAANQAAAGVDRVTTAVRDGAQNMQATPGNIAAQFQDIGVTAAMGMSPLLIALQQGTQLSAAFAGGGLKTLGTALRSVMSLTSLLTIGIVAGVAALIQWGIQAWNSADKTSKLAKAIETTQMTTSAFSDAQSALGGVIDLTTGKIKSQSAALRGLALAQLQMIRYSALKERAEASKTIAQQRGRNTPTISTAPAVGVMGMSVTNLSGRTSTSESQRLLDQFTSGKLNSEQAIDSMERLTKAGKLTETQFLQLTGAVASFGMATYNLKVYEDARKAFDGDQAALKQFLNLPDPKKTPKGPKSDAEKLADVYAGAQSDIATEKARELAAANSLGAFEAAKLEKQTSLLNSIQQKGIPITDAVRQRVAELADEYAKFKTAADVAEVVNSATDGIQKQRDEVADQTKLVGLYGDALARASRELDAQRRLRESAPKDEVIVVADLTGGLSDDIEARDRATRMERVRRDAELSAYAMDMERQSLGLTGAAALEYAFIAERLIEAKRAGIELSPAEVAAINAAGAAYATQRHAIDQQAQAMADAREVTKGFFTDWINGVREGGNVFRAFTDSVLNGLNRIIDKLLDKGIDTFLDSMFKGGKTPDWVSGVTGGGLEFANGGAFGTAQRFANGGAFTNSIVNTPTLFRFANGAALGEMGEAGPEAIMPLKRGPNGALGVQMHGGGKPSVRMGDVHMEIRLEGAMMPDTVVAIARQAGEAAVATVKRDFASIAADWEQNGAVTG